MIGGQTRNSIAALDGATGSATSWNPSAAGGDVYAIAVSGSTVYVGGDFVNIGGQARSSIAALDGVTGRHELNPNAGLYLSKSLCPGGGRGHDLRRRELHQHRRPDAQRHCRARRRDRCSHELGPGREQLRQRPGGERGHGLRGRQLHQHRHAAAQPHRRAGRRPPAPPPPGIPNASGPIAWALAVPGATAHAGGAFTTIGGQPRNRIAALDAVDRRRHRTGIPNADGAVDALAVTRAPRSTPAAASPASAASRATASPRWMGQRCRHHVEPAPERLRLLPGVERGHVVCRGEFSTVCGEPHGHFAAVRAGDYVAVDDGPAWRKAPSPWRPTRSGPAPGSSTRWRGRGGCGSTCWTYRPGRGDARGPVPVCRAPLDHLAGAGRSAHSHRTLLRPAHGAEPSS